MADNDPTPTPGTGAGFRADADATTSTPSPGIASPTQGGSPTTSPATPPSGSTPPAGATPAAAPGTAVLNPNDTRQAWVCVLPEGPRTTCPPFRSDAHKVSSRHPQGEVIRCPRCGSASVRFLTIGLDPEAEGVRTAAPEPIVPGVNPPPQSTVPV